MRLPSFARYLPWPLSLGFLLCQLYRSQLAGVGRSTEIGGGLVKWVVQWVGNTTNVVVVVVIATELVRS
jgi:hypothetical protein